jgi:hypothetical protein
MLCDPRLLYATWLTEDEAKAAEAARRDHDGD